MWFPDREWPGSGSGSGSGEEGNRHVAIATEPFVSTGRNVLQVYRLRKTRSPTSRTEELTQLWCTRAQKPTPRVCRISGSAWLVSPLTARDLPTYPAAEGI